MLSELMGRLTDNAKGELRRTAEEKLKSAEQDIRQKLDKLKKV